MGSNKFQEDLEDRFNKVNSAFIDIYCSEYKLSVEESQDILINMLKDLRAFYDKNKAKMSYFDKWGYNSLENDLLEFLDLLNNLIHDISEPIRAN